MMTDKQPASIFHGVPAPALWLGLAGLIPFWAGALGPLILPDPWGGYLGGLLVPYGAVILSFLGGVHWGLAVAGMGAATPDQGTTWKRLTLSVLPSLIGWAAFFTDNVDVALGILFGGFVVTSLVEFHAAKVGFLPKWYANLRMVLSGFAEAALLVGVVTIN